ncbi:MAG: hypothetical protein ACLQNE_15625 [Thermoguttaceae bacterium]
MSTTSRTRGVGLGILVTLCLIPGAQSVRAQEVFASGREFSVEALGFARTRTVLTGRGLRIFAGRGSAALQDKTVTGVQWLIFPPVVLPNYRFQLSFRDEGTGILIRDAGEESYDYGLITRRSMPVPNLLNLSDSAVVSVLPQRCEWRPNEFFRTGTFHKRLKGKWISFGMETSTRASFSSDEIFLRVKLVNRNQSPLNLTVLPEQTLFQIELPPARGITVEAPVTFTQPDVCTLRTANQHVKLLSDLPRSPGGGWMWSLAPGEESVAFFSIFVAAGNTNVAEPPVSGLRRRMQQSGRAAAERLRWAADRLPSIWTGNRELDDLYYRSILTILENKWDRDGLPGKPYYGLGPDWATWVVPWDISFLSRVLALLDPDSCRQFVLIAAKQGVLSGYAQNFCALNQVIGDYLDQTGDTTILDARVADATLLDHLKRGARDAIKRLARPDGLLQFGTSKALLETRTDGYEYAVAATNGLMASCFRRIAQWCRDRKHAEAVEFDAAAARIEQGLPRLWNEKAGWFESEAPEGSRHLVWSYHVFDLLGTHVLSDTQRLRMVGHLRDGEFLGPYGLYGISKVDRVHWDWLDPDFGGGGQYTAMPMRITESLFVSGQPQLAWDVLLRCVHWSSAYPYLPQHIFTDDMTTIEVGEEPLHICGGAAAQAILFGAFGLRPHADGHLEIAPAYHQSLGEAWLKGYRFRGHVYDVHLTSRGFEVFRDGLRVDESTYERKVCAYENQPKNLP